MDDHIINHANQLIALLYALDSLVEIGRSVNQVAVLSDAALRREFDSTDQLSYYWPVLRSGYLPLPDKLKKHMQYARAEVLGEEHEANTTIDASQADVNLFIYALDNEEDEGRKQKFSAYCRRAARDSLSHIALTTSALLHILLFPF